MISPCAQLVSIQRKSSVPGTAGDAMNARCNACGEVWPRDLALEVECPDCHEPVGSRCRRPSGHACSVHGARDRLAMHRGLLAPCPAERSSPSGTGQLSLLHSDFDLL
jgi:predicted RNA-binding Zn-ribbon protein involved in translation (DUF1610 family)